LWEYKRKEEKRKKRISLDLLTLSNVKTISWRIYVREWILFSVELINLTSLMSGTRNDTIHKDVGREDVKKCQKCKVLCLFMILKQILKL
jgi:hypothetical protein